MRLLKRPNTVARIEEFHSQEVCYTFTYRYKKKYDLSKYTR